MSFHQTTFHRTTFNQLTLHRRYSLNLAYGYTSMEQRTLKNVKQLFEYQHLLLLRDIWWSKL